MFASKSPRMGKVQTNRKEFRHGHQPERKRTSRSLLQRHARSDFPPATRPRSGSDLASSDPGRRHAERTLRARTRRVAARVGLNTMRFFPRRPRRNTKGENQEECPKDGKTLSHRHLLFPAFLRVFSCTSWINSIFFAYASGSDRYFLPCCLLCPGGIVIHFQPSVFSSLARYTIWPM